MICDITDDLQWPWKVTMIYGTLSPEVNKFGTIWKGVYDFLLVTLSLYRTVCEI